MHGKDEFLQTIQILAPRFRLYGTFVPGNANAGGSAICIRKDLLPDDAVVTHVITCQGRDHIVNVRSGYQSLVIVSVHFEPELTLGSLRERLRLITPHWPQYPDAIGMIMGDFNKCEPEEGRFNVWNQTFTDGDMVKAALFHSLFPRVLEIAQPYCTRRAMAEARDFHWYFHVFENLWKRSIPSDHAAVRVVIQKPSGAPGQTHSELDVQTSRFFFNFEAASR